MINKTYKIIHNRFSRFFNYFFFLRYLFTIFLVSVTLFFSIPKFFNYEKKEDIIKAQLDKYYNLELQDFKTIKYNIFPLPNLSINESNFKVKDKPILLKTNDFRIYLNLNNIYKYENFKPKKIIFNKTKTALEISRIKEILKYFDNLNQKIYIKSLNLDVEKNNKILLGLKNINFSNYGYQKYQIKGKIFDKRFNISFKDDNKILNFKILNTGIKAKLVFEDQSFIYPIEGFSQISFPKNHLKFDFKYYKDRLEIIKSNFKNKDISIAFNSLIKFDPFFDINSNIIVKQFNKKKINNLNLDKIISNKEIIKVLNSTNTLNYTAKKYNNNIIKDFNSRFYLTHGRLVFSKNIFISGGSMKCNGESLLIAEYPRLNFICLFSLKDTNEIKKVFSIPRKINLEPVDINVEGSINILNNKIVFKNIRNSEGYVANEDDIKYFQKVFEQTLLNKSFFEIFKTLKIKEFFLTII
tara:strand:- start:858 stop:2261 length:1404 start_codon:yes stop_codon:yes gene_type:complete